ncbi:hypothetical protein C8F01DRAFT_364953 [Mycena amicta]|nr:hypothetical protein C8F01DRAFT_364953 [Mycena amicta]
MPAEQLALSLGQHWQQTAHTHYLHGFLSLRVVSSGFRRLLQAANGKRCRRGPGDHDITHKLPRSLWRHTLAVDGIRVIAESRCVVVSQLRVRATRNRMPPTNSLDDGHIQALPPLQDSVGLSYRPGRDEEALTGAATVDCTVFGAEATTDSPTFAQRYCLSQPHSGSFVRVHDRAGVGRSSTHGSMVIGALVSLQLVIQPRKEWFAGVMALGSRFLDGKQDRLSGVAGT